MVLGFLGVIRNASQAVFLTSSHHFSPLKLVRQLFIIRYFIEVSLPRKLKSLQNTKISDIQMVI